MQSVQQLFSQDYLVLDYCNSIANLKLHSWRLAPWTCPRLLPLCYSQYTTSASNHMTLCSLIIHWNFTSESRVEWGISIAFALTAAQHYSLWIRKSQNVCTNLCGVPSYFCTERIREWLQLACNLLSCFRPTTLLFLLPPKNSSHLLIVWNNFFSKCTFQSYDNMRLPLWKKGSSDEFGLSDHQLHLINTVNFLQQSQQNSPQSSPGSPLSFFILPSLKFCWNISFSFQFKWNHQHIIREDAQGTQEVWKCTSRR